MVISSQTYPPSHPSPNNPRWQLQPVELPSLRRRPKHSRMTRRICKWKYLIALVEKDQLRHFRCLNAFTALWCDAHITYTCPVSLKLGSRGRHSSTSIFHAMAVLDGKKKAEKKGTCVRRSDQQVWLRLWTECAWNGKKGRFKEDALLRDRNDERVLREGRRWGVTWMNELCESLRMISIYNSFFFTQSFRHQVTAYHFHSLTMNVQ